MSNSFDPKDGDHVILMLVSGLMVLGAFKKWDTVEEQKVIYISRPMRLACNPVQLQNGQEGMNIGIGAWLPTLVLANINVHENVFFKEQHLAHPPLEPNKQITSIYIQATSGIQIVPAGAENRIALG